MIINTHQRSVNEVRLKFSEPPPRHKSLEANKLCHFNLKLLQYSYRHWNHQHWIKSFCKIFKQNFFVKLFRTTFKKNSHKNIYVDTSLKKVPRNFKSRKNFITVRNSNLKLELVRNSHELSCAHPHAPSRRPRGRVSQNRLEAHVTSRD